MTKRALPPCSDTLHEMTFFLRFETLFTKDMQRRNKPHSDENSELWYPMKYLKICFWFEICLFSFGGWVFCGFFVFFLQLITFQSSAEPSKCRDKIWNIFLEKINSFMLLLKGTFFVCPFIPKVSLTSVASLTTGITELERVLLWNVNVVYFLCSSFQHFGLSFQILVCGNHKSWGIDTWKMK